MVKSRLSGSHQGLHDWVVQRVTALFMVGYGVGLFLYIGWHTPLSYAQWRHLFSLQSMKVSTILFLAALLWHARVGMWIVLTDYVPSFILRALLQLIVFAVCVSCFVWGILILWSV